MTNPIPPAARAYVYLIIVLTGAISVNVPPTIEAIQTGNWVVAMATLQSTLMIVGGIIAGQNITPPGAGAAVILATVEPVAIVETGGGTEDTEAADIGDDDDPDPEDDADGELGTVTYLGARYADVEDLPEAA